MGIVVVFLLVLLGLMFFGWRARQRRQAGLGQPESVPQEVGLTCGEFDGFYVATTVAGDPLNRIAVRGLGYRSRARITVADAGIVLALRGEPEVFIPTAALREVTRATWTIDRVVEPGGLVLIGWNLGPSDSPTAVDSYFRLESATELLAALNLIFTAPTGRKA
jgi:hypothetical protein